MSKRLLTNANISKEISKFKAKNDNVFFHTPLNLKAFPKYLKTCSKDINKSKILTICEDTGHYVTFYIDLDKGQIIFYDSCGSKISNNKNISNAIKEIKGIFPGTKFKKSLSILGGKQKNKHSCGIHALNFSKHVCDKGTHVGYVPISNKNCALIKKEKGLNQFTVNDLIQTTNSMTLNNNTVKKMQKLIKKL